MVIRNTFLFQYIKINSCNFGHWEGQEKVCIAANNITMYMKFVKSRFELGATAKLNIILISSSIVWFLEVIDIYKALFFFSR